MGRKFYLPLVVLFLISLGAAAQTGEIRGRVIEKGGEGIPFANVAAMMNGAQVQATVTDFDGNYSIKPLNPGKYDVKATSVGYGPAQTSNVLISSDKISFVNLELSKGIEIEAVVITDYAVPLLNSGAPQTQKTITRDEIVAAPTRDVNTQVSLAAGTYQKDEGGAINIRGQRSDATSYYQDGMKVRGNVSLPQQGTEQITVITGGIPAQYGDATGGIISVTTRGPSNTFGGGVELATSEFLDSYGYNLGSFNVTGPLIMKKDSAGNKTKDAFAGFFIAGEYQYDKDPNPSPIPIYKVKDDILKDVRENPLVSSPTGFGYIHRSHFFTNDSLETQKYRENVATSAMRVSGKLDFRPGKNVTLTFGGSFDRTDSRDYIDSYSLMNYDNNPQTIGTNWRVFGKVTHRILGDTTRSSSAVKNLYYTIQADYSKNYTETMSPDHKDRLFDYGYVGKFQGYSVPFYNFQSIPRPSGPDSLVLTQAGTFDTLFTYSPGTQNPYTSNYTQQYYELTNGLGTAGYQDNINSVLLNGGLLNGDNRAGLNVYGIWSTPGRVRTLYQINNNAQARIIASVSGDVKNHNLVAGFEIEQRVDRGYSVNPNGLWGLMRQLGNQRITRLDTNTQTLTTVYNGNQPITFIDYASAQYTPGYVAVPNNSGGVDTLLTSGFYENIRDQIGLNYNDTVQTDAIDPSTYNIGMFTPDELFNSGGSFVNYYGYDYTGELDKNSSWNLNNFYVDRNEKNNFIRRVDAFRPTYIAGYISDKFTLNDIIFNIGVRVDRFDANQKVLKDPYLLYETYKAGDDQVAQLTTKPAGIGDDYAVYVNNSANPTAVVGYRNENQWYDAAGNPTTDLTSLLQSSGNTGSIQPYLTNYSDYTHGIVNPNAFTDYTPQVNVMPRVAFSFPISDEAYFAAHYDVLTQRPQDGNLIRFNPITYLNWSQGITGTFSNPDLKPEKTTNYEIAFQQKLTSSSAFSISAFYNQMRNNIQIINLDYAFPIRYSTYGNIDFGTVKGLTFGYDLRRTSNVRMSISYTLQFAEGTGSDPNTNAGVLSQQGQTNLREVKPLSFDQRHTFVTSFDYHYGVGKDYNGPVWWNKQVFANGGANIVFRAGSGTPYTRKANITPEADFTTTANSRSVISGQLNGSRYPWQFKVDMKIDKSFQISTGTNAAGEDKKPIYATVYLQLLNALNTLNVSTVYRATGSPSDDGYIDSPGAQTSINQKVSPQSYTDLYRIAVNDPDNYNLPRRIRLGIQLNF